jgi:hypothetical protein
MKSKQTRAGEDYLSGGEKKHGLSYAYSGCQKNVPIAERFFATTLMPPSFFRNIIMTSGINTLCRDF